MSVQIAEWQAGTFRVLAHLPVIMLQAVAPAYRSLWMLKIRISFVFLHSINMFML
jgi:hypothetical protein